MPDPGFTQRNIGGDGFSLPRRKPRYVTAFSMVKGRISRYGKILIPWIRQKRTRRDWKILVFKTFGGIAAASLLFLGILWVTLPNIDDPATMFPSQSTVILDRNGVELYRLFSEQDRTYIRGDDISRFIKEATVAIEDERFFGRSACFDVIGYARAALSQIAPSMFVKSGGSTLTQQFAGNALVGRRRSITRKVRELLLACELERKYDKDELLELYLNWIPYGHNAYGVEQASKNYFGTSAKDLTVAQAAVLAALPQRPSYFNPYGYHVRTDLSDRAKNDIQSGKITGAGAIPSSEITIGLLGQEFGSGATAVYVGGRTDQVIRNMLNQQKITQEQFDEAQKDLRTMTFAPERQNIRAPHFVLEMQKQVEALLEIDEKILEQGGLRITTTLDWGLQEIAEKVVAAHKDDIIRRFGAYNLALVALSPGTREVLAYVGNMDFSDNENQGKIDMANAPRQPGSSFKPFTYLAAFEEGYGPGSVTYDVPTKFGSDEPQNYDGTFWGLTSMRQALGGSRNIPAIKAFFLGGGEDALLSLASRIGVTTPSETKATTKKTNPDYDYGWPLAIGAAEVPLVEMAQGYATIADGGAFRPMQNLLKITDKDGNILFLSKSVAPQHVIDERYAAQITSILSDVSARPNDFWKTVLSVPGYQTAGKTGTSNKCLERDTKGGCTLRRPESTWTIGYTPNLITAVWAGNATSQSLYEKADGLTTAAPVWHDFMVEAHRKLKDTKTTFALPERISSPLISRLSGQLASACTPVALQTTDLFLDEKIPTLPDPACVQIKTDKVTGLLASDACPQDAVEDGSFFVPKSELPDRWPTWETDVQEWAKKQMEIWRATEDHSGSLLPLPVAPTEKCDPSLTPGRLNKPSVSLIFPQSNGTLTFPVFSPKFDIQSVSPIRQVQVSIDDKVVATFTESPFSGPVRAPRSIDTTKIHTLTVTVTDTYFNTASTFAAFTFVSDDSAPRVHFSSPTDGVSVRTDEALTIRAEATDTGGIDRVEFYVDSTLLTVKRSAPYELTHVLGVLPGKHTLRVVARDTAGNEAEDEISITVVP